LAKLGLLELLGPKGSLVLKGLQEPPEHRGLLAPKEFKGNRVFKGLLDPKGLLLAVPPAKY
jgi:hypothetical protein